VSDRAPIEFHFDFISPFGYFASLRIDALAAKYGRSVDWRSMLIGVSVLKVMGVKSLLATPLKGDYLRRDFARYARCHGLALARSIDAPPASPLPAGRAFWWLRRHHPDRAKPFAQTAYRAYWAEGRDIGSVEAVVAIAREADAAADDLRSAFGSDEPAALLRAGVEDALAKGVFGSPFFLVDGEPFFGVEKLESMEEWLARGGW
jgi:2-hydroxychromene-2-carboxylate isomerase